MIELLGNDANAPAERAASVFIETTRATLADLLGARRFGREGALDLLAADALMTYAYEHASEQRGTVAQLETATLTGATRIAHLVLPR
jgi:hypothetical protein